MAYLQFNVRSEAIHQCIDVEVALPAFTGLPEPPQPYKTLYFLADHGRGAKETFTFLNIQLRALLEDIAIVTVAGDKSFYIDKPELDENSSEFVSRELPELTRSLLPLSLKKEETWIGGISMGGYGALYNGLRHPDVFGKIIAISPVIDPISLADSSESPMSKEKVKLLFGEYDVYKETDKNIIKVLCDKAEIGEKIPEIFFRCGREDRLVWEQARTFLRAADRCGISLDYAETHGGHDLLYWGEMFSEGLKFLKK